MSAEGLDSDGLVGVHPDTTIAIASKLKITHHRTGKMVPWVINREQQQILRDIWTFPAVFILKVRQIGASTVVCLDDVLWCAVNDSLGHMVRCGIVVDTESKAAERVRVCSSFCEQLGIPHTYQRGTNTITFSNGSEIIGLTAGGKRAGASMTFHRWHLTELPFWRDCAGSYTSLMQALIEKGRVIIETTMGVDDPLAKDLWINPNGYFKRFFSFEDHDEYTRPYDPAVLDPDLEHRLMNEEGFADRDRATDWAYKMKNGCGGDIVRCFREYPQKPEHSWMYAEGRWIKHTPMVLEPLERYPCPGLFGYANIQLFRRPVDGSGHYIIGMDPAGGVGKDSTVVVVVDAVDNQIMACLVDPDLRLDDAVTVAHHLQGRYSSSLKIAGVHKNRIPMVIIEKNGLGHGAIQAAQRTGLEYIELQTNNASRYDGLLYTQRYIESGQVFGPSELADEAGELRVDKGKFKGRKDLCMALGFCYAYIAAHPVDLGRGADREGRVNLTRMLEEHQRKTRR